MVYLHDIVARNGLRWRYDAFYPRGLFRRARRNQEVFEALRDLLDEDMPGVRENSRRGKRQVERYLVEVVDAVTNFVRETPGMMDPMDPLAGLGLTGLNNENFNANENEKSFLKKA